MKTIKTGTNITAATLLTAMLLLGRAPLRAEDEWHRKGLWEAYGTAQYLFGNTVDYSKFGVRLDVENTAFFGAGGEYHISDHWGISVDLLGGVTDFNSSGLELPLNQSVLVLNGNLNVEYDILRQRLTPLLRAGIGFYDYTADAGYWTTYGETDFSWNVSGGLRWDVTDHFVVKFLGGVAWTSLKDSDGATSFGFVTLSIGGSF